MQSLMVPPILPVSARQPKGKERKVTCWTCTQRDPPIPSQRIQGVLRRHVHFPIVDVSEHGFKSLLAGNHFTYGNVHLPIFWHEGTEHGFKVTAKGNKTDRTYSAHRWFSPGLLEGCYSELQLPNQQIQETTWAKTLLIYFFMHVCQ